MVRHPPPVHYASIMKASQWAQRGRGEKAFWPSIGVAANRLWTEDCESVRYLSLAAAIESYPASVSSNQVFPIALRTFLGTETTCQTDGDAFVGRDNSTIL